METYQNQHMLNPTCISRWLASKGSATSSLWLFVPTPLRLLPTIQHRAAAGGSEDSSRYGNRHKQKPTVTWPSAQHVSL